MTGDAPALLSSEAIKRPSGSAHHQENLQSQKKKQEATGESLPVS